MLSVAFRRFRMASSTRTSQNAKVYDIGCEEPSKNTASMNPINQPVVCGWIHFVLVGPRDNTRRQGHHRYSKGQNTVVYSLFRALYDQWEADGIFYRHK
jgi:hypothetical protein